MKPVMHFLNFIFPFIVFISCSGNKIKQLPAGSKGYIGISRENPSFFSFSDGSPFIPIGINMINPSNRYRDKPDSAMLEIEHWMKSLSANGANYIRVWLSQSFWDMEDKKAGEYREEKIKRIDRFVEMARANGLRIKMTLEHFRSVTLQENNQTWANKHVYHTSNGGPLDSIRKYLTSDQGRQLFLNKVDFYKERYGSDTLFFGWELWNEMNAMKGPEDEVFFNWNKQMLKEVKKRFPENLVMQSFGSFDHDGVRPNYKRLMLMPWNEVAQVHRYLDLGAKMDVCHEPMDIICTSAVDEIKSYNPRKPIILAETGAVEPQHIGPFKLYPADTAGILLHDILFAPFFSGAAGAGMSWHWESYVDKNNLWYHFRRFHRAIEGVDPIVENFVYSKTETDKLRIYAMKGIRTNLLWIRDKNNTWQSELAEGKAPELISGLDLDLRAPGISDPSGTIEIYDPWQNKWSSVGAKGTIIVLPDFRRSLMLRIH